MDSGKIIYQNLNVLNLDILFVGTYVNQVPYLKEIKHIKSLCPEYLKVLYATPDGRIIPFCTMNNLHRENVEQKFTKPLNPNQITPPVHSE